MLHGSLANYEDCEGKTSAERHCGAGQVDQEALHERNL
jgi:hypothetical protein